MMKRVEIRDEYAKERCGLIGLQQKSGQRCRQKPGFTRAEGEGLLGVVKCSRTFEDNEQLKLFFFAFDKSHFAAIPALGSKKLTTHKKMFIGVG